VATAIIHYARPEPWQYAGLAGSFAALGSVFGYALATIVEKSTDAPDAASWRWRHVAGGALATMGATLGAYALSGQGRVAAAAAVGTASVAGLNVLANPQTPFPGIFGNGAGAAVGSYIGGRL
jgi:hypothetical protein